jgi:hypothetical protein
MTIAAIAHWYGAARSALRAMLFGLPAPASGETASIEAVSQDQAHDSQRGMVASRLAKMGEGRPGKTSSIDPVSQAQAAEMLNVSERTDLVEIPTKLSQAEAATLQQGGDRQSKDFKAGIPALKQEQAAELELGANQHAQICAPSQRQGERTDLGSIELTSQKQAAELLNVSERTDLSGIPLPSQPQAAELAPALATEPPEPRCQPPESTPGSFNWVRTHKFAATDRDLKCADCSMRWPTAAEPHT